MVRLRVVLGLASFLLAPGASPAPLRAQTSPGLRAPAATRAPRDARMAKLPSGAVKVGEASGGERTAVRPVQGQRDMVQVPISLEDEPVRLGVDAIRLTAGSGRITRTPAGRPVLEVPTHGSAIVSSDAGRASAAQNEISEDRKTLLPWLVVETRPIAGGTELRTSRPFLTLARAITWDRSQQRHIADFLFGLDPEQGEPGPLDQPLDVRFTVSCDEVAPAQARVERAGPAGYGSVRVGCSPAVKNERPQHHIEVHAGRGNLRYPFQIPRRPGPVTLAASATNVLGFGFGSFVLTVHRVEEDGSPLRAERVARVQLLVSGGTLDVSELVIARGASSASAELHPRGIGRLEVSAEAEALRSAPIAIELGWPLLPVLAMIAGGWLGGVLSALAPRRRKLRRRALEGVLVGLLVTAVVLVLPSFAALPRWVLGTELGLFVLAAIAGFAGTPLVDRAARALFPALAQETKA